MHGVDWTSAQLAEAFAPGRELLVLLPGRESFRRRALRQAVVLGLQQGDLAITPPEPALPEPLLGQALEITTLVPEGNRHQRYAYRTCVLDVLDDHPPAPGGRALVVMFPRGMDIYATSLRRARRYRVPADATVRLFSPAGAALALVDISIKGLRCVWEGPADPPPVDAVVQTTLEIHDETFQVHGRVTGIQQGPQRCEVSLELGILPLDAWASLQELIATLEPID
ncbi:MAG: PilZ domain-containing protein [Pseudomonadota bacterium]